MTNSDSGPDHVSGNDTSHAKGASVPAMLAIGVGWIATLAGLAALGERPLPSWTLPTIASGAALITGAAGYLAWQLSWLTHALARATQDRERLAATDGLTGALNRAAFLRLFERDFARCRRHGQPLSLMMLDIDFFRRINDGYGHAAGDQALHTFVATLSVGLRNVDAVGRVGGEEFAIALPDTAGDAALSLANRLRDRVAAIVLKAPNGDEIRFTTSIGVTTLGDADATSAQVIERADTALFQAKANGRNRVEWAAADVLGPVSAIAESLLKNR